MALISFLLKQISVRVCYSSKAILYVEYKLISLSVVYFLHFLVCAIYLRALQSKPVGQNPAFLYDKMLLILNMETCYRLTCVLQNSYVEVLTP